VPVQLPTPNPPVRYGAWSGPGLLSAIVASAGAGAASVLVWALPPPLVLPAVGVLAIIAAIAVAAIAWLTAQRMTASVSYWDIAGALTVIGIFASLLSDPELALPLLESQRTE
jgi:hypothetical protein